MLFFSGLGEEKWFQKLRECVRISRNKFRFSSGLEGSLTNEERTKKNLWVPGKEETAGGARQETRPKIGRGKIDKVAFLCVLRDIVKLLKPGRLLAFLAV